MKHFSFLLSATLLFSSAVFLTGCGGSSDSQSNTPATRGVSRLHVAAGNYPVAYFIERITGDLADNVRVKYFVPADEDPAFWRPSQDQIAEIQVADLVFLNGATYEKWVGRATLRQERVVNTSMGFRNQWIEEECEHEHTHADGHTHSHGEVAFTTWLNPALAKRQASSIEEALSKAMPQHAEVFRANLTALHADLDKLDERFEQITASHASTPLLASHPVYQYFQQRYNLDIVSVHWEPESFPSLTEWNELREILTDHPSKLMIWEGEPVAETAEKLAELGVSIVVFDPAGNRPEEGDLLSVMHENADNLEKALSALKAS